MGCILATQVLLWLLVALLGSLVLLVLLGGLWVLIEYILIHYF